MCLRTYFFRQKTNNAKMLLLTPSTQAPRCAGRQSHTGCWFAQLSIRAALRAAGDAQRSLAPASMRSTRPPRTTHHTNWSKGLVVDQSAHTAHPCLGRRSSQCIGCGPDGDVRATFASAVPVPVPVPAAVAVAVRVTMAVAVPVCLCLRADGLTHPHHTGSSYLVSSTEQQPVRRAWPLEHQWPS
jgi:hypothetical protein